MTIADLLISVDWTCVIPPIPPILCLAVRLLAVPAFPLPPCTPAPRKAARRPGRLCFSTGKREKATWERRAAINDNIFPEAVPQGNHP